MAKKATEERIKEKKTALEKANSQMAALQAKIKKLKEEIEELENFEILSLTKGLDMPVSELKSLIMELKEKKEIKEKEAEHE